MGEVRRLWIEGPAGRLEAALRVGRPAAGAAVIAHPHPLHGGTLHNPVVFHVDRELNRAGLTTLRFNFRGAGTSEGAHDDGAGEVGDIAAAVAWLRGIEPGPLLLAGYSFGAWCALRAAAAERSVAGVIAIGLALRFHDVAAARLLGRPLAVVQGSEDEFGRPAEVASALAALDPPAVLRVVEGATHLFPGRAPEVAELAAACARSMLGGG